MLFGLAICCILSHRNLTRVNAVALPLQALRLATVAAEGEPCFITDDAFQDVRSYLGDVPSNNCAVQELHHATIVLSIMSELLGPTLSNAHKQEIEDACRKVYCRQEQGGGDWTRTRALLRRTIESFLEPTVIEACVRRAKAGTEGGSLSKIANLGGCAIGMFDLAEHCLGGLRSVSLGEAVVFTAILVPLVHQKSMSGDLTLGGLPIVFTDGFKELAANIIQYTGRTCVVSWPKTKSKKRPCIEAPDSAYDIYSMMSTARVDKKSKLVLHNTPGGRLLHLGAGTAFLFTGFGGSEGFRTTALLASAECMASAFRYTDTGGGPVALSNRPLSNLFEETTAYVQSWVGAAHPYMKSVCAVVGSHAALPATHAKRRSVHSTSESVPGLRKVETSGERGGADDMYIARADCAGLSLVAALVPAISHAAIIDVATAANLNACGGTVVPKADQLSAERYVQFMRRLILQLRGAATEYFQDTQLDSSSMKGVMGLIMLTQTLSMASYSMCTAEKIIRPTSRTPTPPLDCTGLVDAFDQFMIWCMKLRNTAVRLSDAQEDDSMSQTSEPAQEDPAGAGRNRPAPRMDELPSDLVQVTAQMITPARKCVDQSTGLEIELFY